MALASAESNAAPSVAKPVAARPAGKRPKNQCVIELNPNGGSVNTIQLAAIFLKYAATFKKLGSVGLLYQTL
ncbi:MAG TPA: hypothetical protein PKH93_03540 [Chitinophagales bacterium]|nr:hypothetical protein [Chitinophagales bacterium]